MSKQKWIVASAASAAVLALAAVGAYVSQSGGGSDQATTCAPGYAITPDIGCIPIPRHAFSTTGPTGTCTSTSPICQGDTLTANPDWIDTATAQTWTTAARGEFCATTISGASWVKNGYPGGHWKTAFSELQGAKTFSEDKSDYDFAHAALVQTTVSGKAYCSNKPRYAGGKWAEGMRSIDAAYAYAVANPKQTGPAISITKGPRPSATWTQCATEGGTCSFVGTKSVRYGLNSTWTTPRSFTGSVACTNAVFGDPLVGANKVCQYQ